MYRAVEAGGGENEGRVVGESTDVDVVFMDVLEIPYHLWTKWTDEGGGIYIMQPRKEGKRQSWRDAHEWKMSFWCYS